MVIACQSSIQETAISFIVNVNIYFLQFSEAETELEDTAQYRVIRWADTRYSTASPGIIWHTQHQDCQRNIRIRSARKQVSRAPYLFLSPNSVKKAIKYLAAIS